MTLIKHQSQNPIGVVVQQSFTFTFLITRGARVVPNQNNFWLGLGHLWPNCGHVCMRLHFVIVISQVLLCLWALTLNGHKSFCCCSRLFGVGIRLKCLQAPDAGTIRPVATNHAFNKGQANTGANIGMGRPMTVECKWNALERRMKENSPILVGLCEGNQVFVWRTIVLGLVRAGCRSAHWFVKVVVGEIAGW